MIFYRQIQGGLIFQPDPEVQQNLEAPVVRWALEVLCLLVPQTNAKRYPESAVELKEEFTPKRYRWDILG